jgi:purine catabolism regulator
MPAPTVSALLAHRELGLRLLTPATDLPDGALDADVSWVHSSDLADPTPFVIPGQVLLTTGTQFGATDHGSSADRGLSPYRGLSAHRGLSL